MDHWPRLMKLAQAGDESAYKSLLTEVSQSLFTYFNKRVKDKGEIEDLVQEVLLGIHSARHTFDTDRPFVNWMYSIARYKVVDYYRIKKKQSVLVDIEILGPEIFGMDLLDEGDAVKLLDQAIEELPRLQKKVFISLKIRGESIQNTAKKMNTSEAAVRVNAHRAYQKVKQFLKERR